MAAKVLPRNNWFDGQQITETDMDVEQIAWHDGLAAVADHTTGSGVEKEFATQPILFDSDNVPSSIQGLIDTENFDGEPIYETDSFGETVFIQPSDVAEGAQLEIEISGSELDGAPSLKIYIFGTIFGGNFVQEVLTFEKNESQVTKNYFTKMIAFMTQDLFGNQNTIITGTACRNNGGRLRILESSQMAVVRDEIMAEQSSEPNMDYFNFKPATLAKTLDILLDEIADREDLSSDDLNIDIFESTTTRLLPRNASTGLIIGEKFKATTNNIQKIQLLLSVEENEFALPGEEFNWSGDIVVGIRKLQTSTTCPTDAIPGTAIEFDPEPSALAEVSFDQNDLAELGVSLSDVPQIVDFVFTQSLLANPNIEPSTVPGDFYILTIRRSGDISVGNIVLQEAANTNASSDEADEMLMSVFSQNIWTDVPESDLWFRIFTDAIRITSGSAFDSGVQIPSPKIKKNEATGVEEPFIEGHHSLIDVSQSALNYIIIQRANNFTDPQPHPATGNLVFTRIEDVSQVSVVSEETLTTLIDAGNEPIVLGSIRDTNPVNNPTIEGRLEFPGLANGNQLTIIQPNSDIILNNLVGSVIIPNVNEQDFRYRIIAVEIITDAYGDVNGDGIIDLSDVSRAQALDGYSKDLESGSLPSVDQKAAIDAKTVTIDEILRADVTEDGVINILDPQLIQQNIALGTAFTAGSTFVRAVLTLENLVDPLSTTVDLLAADPSFNTVPFNVINFRINFVPLWSPSNLIITDLRRFVPKTFTEFTSEDITEDPQNGGQNTVFMPGDLLLGGNLLDTFGDPYKIDLEVNTIVINLPTGSTQGELDIFNNFIKNQMRFADGTFVPSTALDDNQVKVATAIKSFVKDTGTADFVDGLTSIDETIAVLYTQSSGILRIRAANIENISTRPELSTKILLTVYLKKAGFRNSEQTVTSDRVTELLVPV